ncbi:ankyrin repeat protein [Podospora conica]|nr:ankyrin repeat protein [Schizothecium conicum]
MAASMDGDIAADMFDEFILDNPDDQCHAEPLPDFYRDMSSTILGAAPDGLPVPESPSMFIASPSQPSPPSGRSSGSHSDLSMGRTGSNASTETSASSPSNTANTIPGDAKSEWTQHEHTGQETAQPADFQGTINLMAIDSMFGGGGPGFGVPPETTSAMNSPYGNPASGEYFMPPNPNQSTKMPSAPTQGLPSPAATCAYGDFSGAFQHNGTVNPTFPMTTHTSRDVSPLSMGTPAGEMAPFTFQFQPPGVGPQWVQPNMANGGPGFPVMNSMPMAMFPPIPTPPPSFVVTLDTRKNGAKSRVETQITVRMDLRGLPPNIHRVHLPTYTMSKRKLLAKPTPDPAPDMLELHAVVVCTSAMAKPGVLEAAMQRAREAAGRGRPIYPPPPPPDPDSDDSYIAPQDGGEVQICTNCIGRERKRADRKKNKHPEPDSWNQDEVRRIIVFNTHEVKEWIPEGADDTSRDKYAAQPSHRWTDKMHIEVPMRIACYCRHQSEKLGFQVIFTLTDSHFKVFAQAVSNSIMITDDHKAGAGGPCAPVPGQAGASIAGPLNPMADGSAVLSQFHGPDGHSMGSSVPVLQPLNENTSRKRPIAARVPPPETPAAQNRSPVMPTPKSISRSSSPVGTSARAHKRRKPSSSVKIPTSLAMTPLETQQMHNRHTPDPPPAPTAMSSTLSPYSSAPSPHFATTPDQSGYNAGAFGPTTSTPPFITSPSTPAHELHFSGLNVYSNPPSTHQSRAPSPTTESLQHPPPMRTQTDVTMANGYMNATPPPVINKVVPHEGPKSGGIEVSILGSGFENGMEVMFDDVPATTTTYWGPRALVCLLPPSSRACHVSVTLRFRERKFPPSRPPAFFRYNDNDEDQVSRILFAIMADKHGRNPNDIQSLAKMLGSLNGEMNNRPDGDMGGHQGQYTSHGSRAEFESNLLKMLEMIDLDDSPRPPSYNCKRAATGQTMLHLACSLGLQRFVAGLVSRGGVLVNPPDKGGYTPLHMAALNNHHLIVRRLISCGADPSLRTLSGLTPEDLTKSPEVLQALRHVERHVQVRPRGTGGLLSPGNSTASLPSLGEPLSEAELSRYPRASATAGSSEDSSSDGENSDDEAFLEMRRRPTGEVVSEGPPADMLPQPAADARVGSPAAAMAAFKEQLTAQVQQIQQTMALHLHQFRQLPQFPYLPQMPNMALLPEYATLQRLTGIMPRAAPGTGAVPPPAYDEIFPRQDDGLDTKQESAARAALDAEADRKCAAMFDTYSADTKETAAGPSETAEAEESESGGSWSQEGRTETDEEETEEEAPTLLIGRKNAITVEQQEQLRRAHAEKLKRLGRDRNLFFIWIPLLVVVLFASFYGGGVISMAKEMVARLADVGAVEGFPGYHQAQHKRPMRVPRAPELGRYA